MNDINNNHILPTKNRPRFWSFYGITIPLHTIFAAQMWATVSFNIDLRLNPLQRPEFDYGMSDIFFGSMLIIIGLSIFILLPIDIVRRAIWKKENPDFVKVEKRKLSFRFLLNNLPIICIILFFSLQVIWALDLERLYRDFDFSDLSTPLPTSVFGNSLLIIEPIILIVFVLSFYILRLLDIREDLKLRVFSRAKLNLITVGVIIIGTLIVSSGFFSVGDIQAVVRDELRLGNLDERLIGYWVPYDPDDTRYNNPHLIRAFYPDGTAVGGWETIWFTDDYHTVYEVSIDNSPRPWFTYVFIEDDIVEKTWMRIADEMYVDEFGRSHTHWIEEDRSYRYKRETFYPFIKELHFQMTDLLNILESGDFDVEEVQERYALYLEIGATLPFPEQVTRYATRNLMREIDDMYRTITVIKFYLGILEEVND